MDKLRAEFADAPTPKQKHLAYLKIQQFNRTVPEDAQITDKSLKTAQKRLLKEAEEGKTVQPKFRDIDDYSKKLNPGHREPKRRVIEYSF